MDDAYFYYLFCRAESRDITQRIRVSTGFGTGFYQSIAKETKSNEFKSGPTHSNMPFFADIRPIAHINIRW